MSYSFKLDFPIETRDSLSLTSPGNELSIRSISTVRGDREILLELEVQGILGMKYERQAAMVRPELRRACTPLIERTDFIIDFRESGYETFAIELCKTRMPECRDFDGECQSKN